MSDAPIIRLRDLRKVYRTGKVFVEALRGVNLDVPKGEFLSVVGPSGSGKSTLFHIVGGLTPPTSGEVIVGGVDVGAVSDARRTELRRTSVSFIFQKFNLLPNLTARDNIRTALYIAGRPMDRFEDKIRDLLELLGIENRLDHRPAELSGGEQQRVAIARALANGPKVLLADEPTGNLDVHTADIVFDELLAMVRDQRVAALIATHNPELAARMDRTVTLREGRVVPV
jgi:putative ABC transport system ATP-binding protein